MYTFDHGLFMALNFDGGTALDRVMLTISGTAMWLPLYALILWLVWRRSGWRGMSVFLVLMLLALMVVCTLVICYSRIYLGKHFPMDIVWGTLVGLGLGYAALRGYLRLAQSRNRRFTHPG